MKKSEIINIFENGTQLLDWAIDTNEFGDLESNGGREFLVAFENNYYLIQTTWNEEPFSGSKIFKKDFDEDDELIKVINEYEKGL